LIEIFCNYLQSFVFKTNIGCGSTNCVMDHHIDEGPVTRTFRIEKRFDDALREEASKLGTSVNSIANHILKKYTESDRHFGEGQSITLSPRTHQNILNRVDEDQIIEAGRESGLVVPKDRLFMGGMPLDRDSVIWYISQVLGGYDDWFTCDVHERKDGTHLHLRHVYNIKWSLFLEGYISALIEEILEIKDAKFDVTNSTVSVLIKK